MTQIRLFVPADGDPTLGAYAYDRRMIAALRGQGHDAEAITVGDAASDWQAVPDGAAVLIDARILAAFLPHVELICRRGAVALVHHPTALEPGLSEPAHEALRAAEQQILPRLPRIVVASEAVAARLHEAFGLSYAQLAIVPPGVDPASRSAGSGGPTCRLLSIGALVPRKGHDVLLRALARLFDLDWDLTIVGTAARHPAHAAALHGLVGELGIASRVHFAASLDDAALAELWQRTDIFVLATHWEASPGPTADALRRGIPVVVCDGGAAGALLTPQAGCVIPTGDAEGFSKSLRRMIFDGAIRAELAAAAWQIGEGLPSWENAAAMMLAALAAP